MSTSIMIYYWYILISIKKNTPVFTEMSQELFYWNVYCIIYLH